MAVFSFFSLGKSWFFSRMTLTTFKCVNGARKKSGIIKFNFFYRGGQHCCGIVKNQKLLRCVHFRSIKALQLVESVKVKVSGQLTVIYAII